MSEGGGFFQAIRNIRSTFGGLSLFCMAMYWLVFNETDSKAHTDALDEAMDVVVETSAMPEVANEGKLVSARGQVTASQGVTDPEFGVRSQGVGLRRRVAMYQWIEIEETEGSGRRKKTTYSYVQDFSEDYQDSSKFHNPAGHENPPMPMQSQVFLASDAKIGGYTLSPEVLESAFTYESDSEIMSSALSEWVHDIEEVPDLGASMTEKGWVYLGSAYGKLKNSKAGEFDAEEAEYYAEDGDYALGDLLVSFQDLPQEQTLTVTGLQSASGFKPWKSENGRTLLAAVTGSHSAKYLLGSELKATAEGAKMMRYIGLLLAAVGFGLMCSGAGAFLENVPILGRMLQFSLFFGGALVGAVFGVIAIILGWLAARPIVTVLIIGSIIGTIVWRAKVTTAKRLEKENAERIARAADIAKQRQFERTHAGTPPPPPPAGSKPAASPGMPPPPPPRLPSGIQAPALRPSSEPAKAALQASPVSQDVDHNGDLPPLEWTPSFSSAPPAVMPKKPAAVEPPPPFDAIPFESSKPSAPTPPAAMASPPNQPGATAAAKSKAKRVELSQHEGYTITKIERVDGPQAGEIMCFELLEGKEVLARGSQEEIKRTLAAKLAAKRGY